MGSTSAYDYEQLLNQLTREYNISKDLWNSLDKYYWIIQSSDDENSYSKPMPWIGMYIALASLFCILPMVADLLHGIRNRKYWFPCKYFTLNAASLTVIAVAMKLPVDLNNPMPGAVDQAAKLGSVSFMCTMMANSLPSLAAMDNKELLTNIIALDILVITLVVNVCIEMKTGVFLFLALIYVVMLLMILLIQTCSALMISKSKQILELKYQTGHETALKDLEVQPGRLTVAKLKKHVRNHWIMAGTGSPQFITACSATTSASGVICVLCTIGHAIIFFFQCLHLYNWNSDYKWSMLVILMIQFIGTILGTIAPFSRCFAALSFKFSIKWIWNHINVFKVESYWTQKLCDWKQSSIPFSISSHKCKVVIENLKKLILSFCIGIQKTIVVGCKMIALIPIFFVICVLYCICCWKWIKSMLSTSGIVLVKTPEQLESNKDFRRYVLQLQDDMEVTERTLKSIKKSVNRVIQKTETQQPNKLTKLLEESSGFEGVGKYDSHYVPPLFADEYPYPDCWSLVLVTLTTIAISLPNIQNNIVHRLLIGVSEGLTYVKYVEESLNAVDEYVSIQKAAKMLWLEVEVYHKWLGNKLRNPALQVNTARQIIEWFRDIAKNTVEVEGSDENSFCRSICANSMYRITETILLSYNTNTEQVSQEELFTGLSSMIADILAACLTNLPQVIAIKCHTSVIEKREDTVHAAAILLGETRQIINFLQERELPSLNPDEFPFIVHMIRSVINAQKQWKYSKVYADKF